MKKLKEFKFDSKNCKILAIVCFALMALLLAGFGVSGIVNRSSAAERFLNKYEKVCQEGNRDKLLKMYAKEAGYTDANALSIPYEGHNPDLLFEGIEKTGNKEYELTYTVIYEYTQEKNAEDGTQTVKVPFCETGNKLHLQRKLTGFRILSEE